MKPQLALFFLTTMSSTTKNTKKHNTGAPAPHINLNSNQQSSVGKGKEIMTKKMSRDDILDVMIEGDEIGVGFVSMILY